MDFSWLDKVERPRIVTHRDTDGIMCGVLFYCILKDKNPEIVTTDYDELDPSSKSKEKFKFTANDIVLDLPQPNINVLFWADHHQGKKFREPVYPYIYNDQADSCTGLLYSYLVKKYRFLKRFSGLIAATDMVDAAKYPNAQYHKNIDDYGNKIRLGLDVGAKIHDNMFYKPMLIKEIATARNWRKVLNSSFHMTRVHTSIFQYQEYEKEAIHYLSLHDRVVCSDLGDKRLPGLLNRYYAFEVFPQVYYGIAVYMVRGVYRIVLSLNTFNKDANKNNLNLGKIAISIDPKGGGHEGIGIISGIKKEKKEETINYLLDLMNKK